MASHSKVMRHLARELFVKPSVPHCVKLLQMLVLNQQWSYQNWSKKMAIKDTMQNQASMVISSSRVLSTL